MPYVLEFVHVMRQLLEGITFGQVLSIAVTFVLGLVSGHLCSAWYSYKESIPGSNDDHPVSAPKSSASKQTWINLDFTKLKPEEMQDKALEFYKHLNRRRTVREFSNAAIPPTVIDNILRAASTAPSGAHTQPWHFAVVTSKAVKSQLRSIVEDEERINYERRMGQDWVNDLQRFKTTWSKPYIDIAPAVIVILRSPYSYDEEGNKQVHYYHELSTGIACGMLVTAIHNAGLVTVTSTPLNAGKRIKQLLDRPSHEKVVLLLPIGYPANGCQVPVLTRKPLEAVSSHH
eukprot:TRINITY_DN11691_c0_g1_i12.p2 TRINITY_DN11691_c0_g1~~TRINITY_DN11691_c0_g1_i12.p2  ORF type:complete len:288 (+),score=36.11 TRINITY_DN11691_c0_g1_i12:62-925(+)